jgi:predicted dehydrogenase
MIAHQHVARWRAAGAEIVAVADINAEVLDNFAQTHTIPITHTAYEVLVHQESAVDIVDICTPPWLHAPVAIAALAAGKHVLCEKPFARTAAEAEAMAKAADAAGKVLACRQGDMRLARESRTVRALVQSRALGDIYFIRLITRSLYRPGLEYNPGAYWFLDRSRAGGGVLFDLGVYDLDLLYSVFGWLEIEDIMATTFRGVDHPALDVPFDVEEHAVAMITLRSGMRIYWEQAWATHLPPENRWDFYGTEAGFSFVPHSAVHRVDMNARLTRYGHRGAIDLTVPPLAPPGPNVYEDFLLAVEGAVAPACPGWEAAHMLRLIEAIYSASAKQ